MPIDQVDYKIPLNFQFQQPDVNTQLAGALTLANAFDQRRAAIGTAQKKQAFESAAAQPEAVGFNGMPSQQLMSQFPEQAQQMAKTAADITEKQTQADVNAAHSLYFNAQEDEKNYKMLKMQGEYTKMAKATIASKLGALDKITDPQQKAQAYQQFIIPLARGVHIDATELPDQYDPNAVEIFRQQAISYDKQVDDQLKQVEANLKAQELPIKQQGADAATLNAKAHMVSALKPPAQSLSLEVRQSQFDDRQWERAGAALNVLNASSRKAIGVAANANMRADRALKILDDPAATPQDIEGLAITDIGGIMKGGVPDEQLMKSLQYKSIKDSYARFIARITSKPQSANTPELRAHLKKIVLELKDIDNKVIERNAGVNTVIFKRIATAEPERWAELVAKSTEAGVGIGASVDDAEAKLKAAAAGGNAKAQQYLTSKGIKW